MTPELQSLLKAAVRTIPDFPKAGIMFRDVTTLFGDQKAFKAAVDALSGHFAGMDVGQVAGIEARGFVLGGALAHQLGAGFTAVRKKGKLPHKVYSQDYQLEYGTDTLEVHVDAVSPGTRVVVVDDLLATGGTACAAIQLLRQAGAEVIGAAFVIDLPDLGGGSKIEALGVPVTKLIDYAGH